MSKEIYNIQINIGNSDKTRYLYNKEGCQIVESNDDYTIFFKYPRSYMNDTYHFYIFYHKKNIDEEIIKESYNCIIEKVKRVTPNVKTWRCNTTYEDYENQIKDSLSLYSESEEKITKTYFYLTFEGKLGVH